MRAPALVLSAVYAPLGAVVALLAPIGNTTRLPALIAAGLRLKTGGVSIAASRALDRVRCTARTVVSERAGREALVVLLSVCRTIPTS